MGSSQSAKLLTSLLLIFALLAATPFVSQAKGLSVGAQVPAVQATSALTFTFLGRIKGGPADQAAYDSSTQRLFVASTKSLQILDISDPSNPTQVRSLSIEALNAAVHNGVIAIAVQANPVTDPGSVIFINSDGNTLKTVMVGAMPNHLIFTPNGQKLLVANKGMSSGSVDPEGSVSIIDLSGGVNAATATTVNFQSFNSQRASLVSQGIRIYPSADTVAKDLEPEWITLSPDASQAFITFKVNNAIAVLNLGSSQFTQLISLGSKDFSQSALDPSNVDGPNGGKAINIQPWPVYGLYMPGNIGMYTVNGQTYYITANEGEYRSEHTTVKSLNLDPTAFPNAAQLKQSSALGYLRVSSIDGDTNGDGNYEKLYAFGGRSFSIWDANWNQVYDSGDQFEQMEAQIAPNVFNASNNDPASWDTRSPFKGPEPEAVRIATLSDGRTYAFIGIEDAGSGAMVYDVTNPAQGSFVDYVRNDTDMNTEGLAFIPAQDSPNGNPLLVTLNTISKTTAIYQIEVNGTPVTETPVPTTVTPTTVTPTTVTPTTVTPTTVTPTTVTPTTVTPTTVTPTTVTPTTVTPTTVTPTTVTPTTVTPTTVTPTTVTPTTVTTTVTPTVTPTTVTPQPPPNMMYIYYVPIVAEKPVSSGSQQFILYIPLMYQNITGPLFPVIKHRTP